MACEKDQHRYYVAETVGVEAEGTMTVIIVCTSCGDFVDYTVQVSKGKNPMILRSETKNKK